MKTTAASSARRFLRWARALAAFCLALLALVAPAGAMGAEFARGDLFVSDSATNWLRSDGTAVGTTLPLSGWSVAVGLDGRVYDPQFGDVVAISANGTAETVVDSDPQCETNSITFNAHGDFYVGEFLDTEAPPCGIRQYTEDGTLVARISDRESDWIDLAADQCTLWYQNGNSLFHTSINACTGVESGVYYAPHFADYGDIGGESTGLRILPDGTLLATYSPFVARYGTDGTIIHTYTVDECDTSEQSFDTGWHGLALSPSGTSFWSSCRIGGAWVPFEIDVATGAALRTLPEGRVVGVYGEWRAAADRVAPTVNVSSPGAGNTYTLGQQVIADYTCTDTGGSDIASCIGTVGDGAALNTSSLGAKSFTVTATDRAGNSNSVTTNYAVVYPWSGFFQPVDNEPTFNVMRAGLGVPVRFGLGGNQGSNIFAPGYPTSVQIPCDSASPQDTVEETLILLTSRLAYSAATRRYTYSWRTQLSWRGTCRALVLRLQDGTEHRARFKFR